MILVIAEQRDGKLNRTTWETIVAAQQLAGATTGATITVLVPGAGGSGVRSDSEFEPAVCGQQRAL